MMYLSSKQEVFAMKKDNYVSVSLDLVNTKTDTKKQKKDHTLSLPPQEDLKQDIKETQNDAKDIDVGDLFNNVWTKDISKQKEEKKKPIDNKRFQEIQKKLEKSKKRDAESTSEKIQHLTEGELAKTQKKQSTGNVVNEFHAKIQAIVYQYFSPPLNSHGNSVRAVLELDAYGNMLDFRILNYSNNQFLNDEANRIKARLRGVAFPAHPKNKSGRYTIILKAEE